MDKVLYRAASRGHANLGWLDTRYTFDFADYYGASRPMGMLRALNDDVLAPGKGFDTRRQDNMEVITIPLDGKLLHRDSIGNSLTVRPGQVQVMSAGAGIAHSEYNGNNDLMLTFLQIWITPDRMDIDPRYAVIDIDPEKSHNALEEIVGPASRVASKGRIHQKAWLSVGALDRGRSVCYNLHEPSDGVYLFIVSGHVTTAGTKLHPRDGLGIWNTDKAEITADTEARLLVVEVPVK